MFGVTSLCLRPWAGVVLGHAAGVRGSLSNTDFVSTRYCGGRPSGRPSDRRRLSHFGFLGSFLGGRLSP